MATFFWLSQGALNLVEGKLGSKGGAWWTGMGGPALNHLFRFPHRVELQFLVPFGAFICVCLAIKIQSLRFCRMAGLVEFAKKGFTSHTCLAAGIQA
jgi:hypothetical protein